MLTLIHGEHTVHSRDKFTQVLAAARDSGAQITRFTGKELTPALLTDALNRVSLFSEKEVLVVEELHSLPASKQRTELITMLAGATEKDIVVWEKRDLTATMLKPFAAAQVSAFPLSKKMFSFIESIGTYSSPAQCVQAAHAVYEQDGAYFLFAMLCRQIRLLISAHDDGTLKGAPFMIAKIKKQAQAFSLQKLLTIHAYLLEIDTAEKQSGSALTLEQQLDLLWLSL